MQPQLLVPLDRSPLAETMLPHAAMLARAPGSSLIGLRLVPPLLLSNPIVGLVPTSVYDDAISEAVARDYLTTIAANLAAPDLPAAPSRGT